VVSLGYITQASLPAPLARAVRRGIDGRSAPQFVAGAGNTYVLAFCTSFTGSTPSSAIPLSGSGVVPTSVPVGTQLNIAINQGGTWVDVGSASVTATGAFASTPATVALPGIRQTGSYLVYVPAAGTNTVSINLGFALLADDSSGLTNGLQFVQLEDGSGNALPTPTTTFFPVHGGDLDGQSLTPDATRGAVIDGGNTVYFFSGIPQHTFTLASQTVSVSPYGGDGDSIASLPNGDQVIVSADNGGPLVVISGILAGNPVIADLIGTNNRNNALRDGLVISNDGKVLLSRGFSGLDVYKIVPTAAHVGATGVGTTSYAVSPVTTFATGAGGVAVPALEDGRDGMAISPADSSRAVVVGTDSSGKPTVQLLTGLTGTAPTIQSRGLSFSPAQRSLTAISRRPEPSPHRAPFAVTPSVGTTLYAVSITPDGTTAYVSTDAGIITVSGVATGNLAQVGSVYSPTLTVPGASGGTCKLQAAASIGILPDGKYLVASVNCGLNPGTTTSTQGAGILVTIPIGAGGALGAPTGQLNQVVTPFNDQIIVH
jgi:hypothetical protein